MGISCKPCSAFKSVMMKKKNNYNLGKENMLFQMKKDHKKNKVTEFEESESE